MAVLYLTHERFADHPGPDHPERPARLGAVRAGAEAAGLGTDLVVATAREAPGAAVAAVHRHDHLERLAAVERAGGGRLDVDTAAGPASFEAARLAAGAGLTAIDGLRAGGGDAAFCAVRPPGHHATPGRAMGFCLLNSIAVSARSLAAAGERVAIVDIDAHHGNGTQDAFWSDPDVLFVSVHQWPLYPGTGAAHERGEGAGTGTTANVPVPAGATGDVYLRTVDEVIAPLVERHRADWLLVSCGFDAHRADPLTDLGLSAGDYGAIVESLAALADPGRLVLFLEGGYDLPALERSTTAVIAALAGGRVRPEPATSGGPGGEAVDAAVALHAGG